MDETQAKVAVPDKNETAIGADVRPQAPGDESHRLGSVEINLGDFTRTLVLMKSLRLMLNNQIAVSAEELASGVGEAGRKFKMGDIEQANQDVGRLYSAFGQKANQWESQARRLEQQMKMQAAKDPKSISMHKMNEMKSEQIAVRTRIRTADVQFRRLHQGLEAVFTTLQRQPSPATSDAADGITSAFMPAFKAAAAADRPEVVKQYFDIETILKVNVSKGAKAGFDVKFDPMPPLDRDYFLTKTARIIRLEQLQKVVLFQDLESGRQSEMTVVDFVKHVQSGAWLLKSRS